MIVVLASFRVKDGSWDAVRAEIVRARAVTRQEEGNLSYDFHADLSDENRLVVVERWTSHDALLHHMTLPQVALWRAGTKDHLSDRTVEIIHPAKVEPL